MDQESTALQQLSDVELVEKFRNGCDDAFSILFHRYRRLAFFVAKKYISDQCEVEDVVQQIFLAIFQDIHTFDPARGKFVKFFMNYAHHRSFNYLESLKTKGLSDWCEFDETTHIHRRKPGWDLTQPEVKRLVEQALPLLKPQRRIVIQLFYLEGIDMEEIPQRTGFSYGEARNHFYRGMAELQTIIKSERPVDQYINQPGGALKVGDLELSQTSRSVTRAGKPIPLSQTEFDLLAYFMMNARMTVTRAMILKAVWEQDSEGETNLLDVYLTHLRKKIEANFETKLIHTERGIGYFISETGKRKMHPDLLTSTAQSEQPVAAG